MSIQWTRGNTEELISLPHRPECIWNIKNATYLDREKREKSKQAQWSGADEKPSSSRRACQQQQKCTIGKEFDELVKVLEEKTTPKYEMLGEQLISTLNEMKF